MSKDFFPPPAAPIFLLPCFPRCSLHALLHKQMPPALAFITSLKHVTELKVQGYCHSHQHVILHSHLFEGGDFLYPTLTHPSPIPYTARGQQGFLRLCRLGLGAGKRRAGGVEGTGRMECREVAE